MGLRSRASHADTSGAVLLHSGLHSLGSQPNYLEALGKRRFFNVGITCGHLAPGAVRLHDECTDLGTKNDAHTRRQFPTVGVKAHYVCFPQLGPNLRRADPLFLPNATDANYAVVCIEFPIAFDAVL